MLSLIIKQRARGKKISKSKWGQSYHEGYIPERLRELLLHKDNVKETGANDRLTSKAIRNDAVTNMIQPRSGF